jgi:hypothetical protein
VRSFVSQSQRGQGAICLLPSQPPLGGNHQLLRQRPQSLICVFPPHSLWPRAWKVVEVAKPQIANPWGGISDRSKDGENPGAWFLGACTLPVILLHSHLPITVPSWNGQECHCDIDARGLTCLSCLHQCHWMTNLWMAATWKSPERQEPVQGALGTAISEKMITY